MSVDYHCNDFEFEEWGRQADKHYASSAAASEEEREIIVSEVRYGNVWNDFYNQQGRSAYQMRRYLVEEFRAHVFDTPEPLKIIDVGAGVGSTAAALLKGVNNISEYCATDCSPVALTFLSSRLEDVGTVALTTKVWDISSHPWLQEGQKYDRVMCIFTLSAVHPELHKKSLENLASALDPGGAILFRDYAVFDMTMYRHKATSVEHLYQRLDHTLAYFFEKEKMKNLVTSIDGLELEECTYCCVKNVNRKTKQELNRVFLHAVIRKKA